MTTVRELPDSTLESGEFLLCEDCLKESSATKGDYFWMPDYLPIYCCGRPMVLAKAKRLIERVA